MSYSSHDNTIVEAPERPEEVANGQGSLSPDNQDGEAIEDKELEAFDIAASYRITKNSQKIASM